MGEHDEYTDYSCSTSTERLARDVETLFRKWHVHAGSDRHVSNATRETRVKAIRTEKIVWNISFYYIAQNNEQQARIHCDLELELTLWDGPPPGNYAEDGLPFSLQRRPLEDDWFNNFSSIFGIGQHITLTPCNPTALCPDDKPLNPSYQQLLDFLTLSILMRHDEMSAPFHIASVLTGWLQTALNLAASNCDCQFPLFGVWGTYQPSDVQHALRINPPWMDAIHTIKPSQNIVRRRRQPSTTRNGPNNSTAQILTGHILSDCVVSSFSCNVLQSKERNKKPWTVWGDLLQHHCGSTGFVQLWKARHSYVWCKQRPKRSLLWEALGGSKYDAQQWREVTGNGKAAGSDTYTAIDLSRDQTDIEVDLESYRFQCQRYALKLIERAVGASETDPLWGPPDDPIESVHFMVTWDGTTINQPVLTLPLQPQSRYKMSFREWEEMEEATESAILDPHRPSSSIFEVYYDHDAAHASQAAIQRCVLAALIRTATLPRETLLAHLTDESLISRWDNVAGNRIAGLVSRKCNVDTTTRTLVAAMDWDNASSDCIEHWQAVEIVESVLDGSPALGFPSPPDSVLSALIEENIHLHGVWKPLLKAAPPGRLLSLLFVHLANVRSPSSMAMVWNVFVQELRRRWDARESLPNMAYVPGLDSQHSPVSQAIGAVAQLAALVHSSEPDPDDNHCLIGQKLQVFNLGLESVISSEIRLIDQQEKRRRIDNTDESATLPTTRSQILLNDSVENGLPAVTDGMDVDEASGGASQEFYDADENDSGANPTGDGTTVFESNRKGARCPIMGVSLVSTGDQVYAPYLQRSFPLTDDVLAERRLVFSRQNSGKASTTMRQRLEIAQRFQRPKLSSDMQAFKAANPGATFQDFIGWYGNPNDPLVDLSETESHELRGVSGKTTVVKIDKAAEAIRALEQTREFWTTTWDEAGPVPAAEQEALFDADSTVEMALDYLENIHPATLLCQVLSVNLSTAYFVLATSAGETVKIRPVTVALDLVREKINVALELLSRDTTRSFELSPSPHQERTDADMMVSVEAVTACTKACVALTTAEVIMARSASLLHKLPQQYGLVETLLKLKEGAPFSKTDFAGGSAFLKTVREQQEQLPKAAPSDKVKPAVREYILRNMDDGSPCQLCVRYSDDGMDAAGAGRDGTVMAMTKSSND